MKISWRNDWLEEFMKKGIFAALAVFAFCSAPFFAKDLEFEELSFMK